MENPPIFMGKSTVSTGPFSSSQTVNVYQRVDIEQSARLVVEATVGVTDLLQLTLWPRGS